MSKRLQIGFFIFDGVELLDLAGPLEVFAVADELSGRCFAESFTFSGASKPVRSVAGLHLVPDRLSQEVDGLDLLVIPGGEGVRHWMKDLELLNELQRIKKVSSMQVLICSSALAAAEMGWIGADEFCTHHLVAEEVLERLPPGAQWLSDQRFVKSGSLYSSAGISAGIDLALHLVERLHSRDLASATAHYMEYRTA